MKKIRFPFTAHLDVPFNDRLTVDVRLTKEQERALAEAAEEDVERYIRGLEIVIQYPTEYRV